mgnify:CR=1 FL=1|tara:strand:- start:223 stop:435 length:213 start_codon:yes stop_codon:yes gene_type:complete
MSDSDTLSDVATFCEVQLMSEQKKSKIPKKTLADEIVKLGKSKHNLNFDYTSLQRTNIENLEQIKILLTL